MNSNSINVFSSSSLENFIFQVRFRHKKTDFIEFGFAAHNTDLPPDKLRLCLQSIRNSTNFSCFRLALTLFDESIGHKFKVVAGGQSD